VPVAVHPVVTDHVALGVFISCSPDCVVSDQLVDVVLFHDTVEPEMTGVDHVTVHVSSIV